MNCPRLGTVPQSDAVSPGRAWRLTDGGGAWARQGPHPHAGQTRDTLKKPGAEAITKNGHSMIVMMNHGPLRVTLGGNLNTQAQNFLPQHPTAETSRASTLYKNLNVPLAKIPTAQHRRPGDTRPDPGQFLHTLLGFVAQMV